MAKHGDALVVDASVAAKWFMSDEEHADKAMLLLERFAEGRTRLIAPEYIRYEVASAITVATQGRQARVSQQYGEKAIARFQALGIETLNGDELILAAYSLVHQYGCALYDALYLTLAQRLGLPLITADRKLYLRIRSLPDVIWIGDYSPSAL